ncbi:MAG: glycosyltransferase family 39 protein [Dehalococcoidia bacterium]|nr:glycosyltransferase family 39 protein [Dehalococcoidia bacterium]
MHAWTAFRPHVFAIFFCLVALVSAGYVSTTVFDRLPHTEDEIAYLFQAKTIASGEIVAKAPALPDFFAMPFVIVREGMWFGKYPPGYPTVLALGALIGQPWLINPLFGALSAGLLYLVGRRLYGAATGLLAAFLALISPFFLIQSGSFLSHTVSLFWALASALLFEATLRKGSRAAGLGAGAAVGMLFVSRPLTGVGIALPFIVWAAIDVCRVRRRRFVYLPMALGFLPFLAALLAYNRLTTGAILHTGYELWWPYDRIGFGAGVGVEGEHTLAEALDTVQMNVDALAKYLFGWPGRLSLLPAAFGAATAIVRVAVRRLALLAGNKEASFAHDGTVAAVDAAPPPPEAWDLLQIGVAVSLVAVYMAYWAAGQMYGPRYYFEALGALLLLSARGLVSAAGLVSWLLRRLAPALRHARPLVTSIILLVVAGLAYSGFTAFVPREFSQFVGWYGVNGSDLRLVQSAKPGNAVVFVKADHWTTYAPFFSQDRPKLDGDVVYARDLGCSRNGALMALYPGRSFFTYARRKLEMITDKTECQGPLQEEHGS